MNNQFITDVVVVSSKDKCPPGYSIINNTTSGNDADLYEGSLVKRGERYLCFAKILGAQIVTDLNIVKEKDPVPTGFTAIKTCKNDAGEKALRKHTLVLKSNHIQNVQTGLVDILAVQTSKGEFAPGDCYTITNDVNGLNICYRTMSTKIEHLPTRQPASYGYPANMPYKPPNVQPSNPSSGLPYPTSSHHSGYRMPFPSSYQQTPPPANDIAKEQPVKKLNSAIQGVQFQVNPKFELLWKKADPLGKSTRTCSLNDIERKYAYSFETERSLLSSR